MINQASFLIIVTILLLIGLFYVLINLNETVIVLATALFIGWQAWETRKSAKFLEYQVRPATYPLILRTVDSNKSILFVKNDSKLKLFFNFRIKENNEIVLNFRDKPLHVFPGIMNYPDALHKLDEILRNDMDHKERIFKIEYKIAPVNVPKKEFNNYLPDEWIFRDNKWIGPDGIEPKGVKSLIFSP